jgi:RNA polymerase sigma factor (sigma-70 family)
MRYARSRAHADDLLQETFLRVFERLPQFRREGSFDGWMRRVAVTTCLDHFRTDAQRWLRATEIDQAAAITSEDADAINNLAQQDLIHLISTLPDGYRIVLNLYCLEGYSHREIGERLGIDERTSSSQLAKARRLLAERVRRAESVYSNDLLP